ncbi:hypothetical protein SISSUDRAFT_485903 [Sistotremastrum suecicum HHB10207 ss-3]|uniref:G-protein coupled receptors family 2 profile 2 domain-containing protein n=1 Tax=Sistotremastrum suecicum HHB10207 ss-3 TaxID=1314776 RepID=A0A165Y1X5_9AGAM|nr:hypothetical protein SISSUDRAFT_485903 [Sistotremastrum suecicum HHB10207 ss-3]
MLSPSQQVQLYLAIQIIGGHIGLPFLILTFLWLNVARSKVVVHFCVSWIVFSVSYSLLIYVSLPLEAPSTQGICLLSDAMTNGALIMTSLSTFALLLNLWFGILQPLWFQAHRFKNGVESLLISIPYVGFFATFFATYTISAPASGIPNPNTFSDTYCLSLGNMWIAVDLISISILGLATLLDILILWSVFRKPMYNKTSSAARKFLIKLSLFGAYRAASLVLSLVVSIKAIDDEISSVHFLDLEYAVSVLQQTGGCLFGS